MNETWCEYLEILIKFGKDCKELGIVEFHEGLSATQKKKLLKHGRKRVLLNHTEEEIKQVSDVLFAIKDLNLI